MTSHLSSGLHALETFLWSTASACAGQWFAAQGGDTTAAFYLYFRPSGEGRPGAIAIAADAPNTDWQLASPERFSPAWTQDKARAVVYEAMRPLPILPLEGQPTHGAA